jgi:hypothetical protein
MAKVNANDCHAETGNCIVVDSLTRVSHTSPTTSSSSGRGSLAGWTLCPLCGDVSKQRYSLGRGIANHLTDVHTPWKPSKLAQKIHRRNYEAEERRKNRSRKRRRDAEGDDEGVSDVETKQPERKLPFQPLKSWEPSTEEQMAWKAKMIHILTELECISSVDSTGQQIAPCSKTGLGDHDGVPRWKDDRNGRPVTSYRDSLPPFLQAAAQGDLRTLQDLIQRAQEQGSGSSSRSAVGVERVMELLDTKDRHNSTADHWAAGGGHLNCLRYLYKLRADISELTSSHDAVDNRAEGDCDKQADDKSTISTTNDKIRLVRRRDGKTCLHYAARNGHVDCIRFLLTELDEHQRHSVDERSGEGTTPLHLACYGGHPHAVKYLVEAHGANVHTTNDWGCSCAHWVAMTVSTVEDDVRKVCNYLRWQCGVSFMDRQRQGHSPLHKAALRKNRHVIQWFADPATGDTKSPPQDTHQGSCFEVGGAGLSSVEKEVAGGPDNGGHRPSDILTNMGGDVDFANWMKETMKW